MITQASLSDLRFSELVLSPVRMTTCFITAMTAGVDTLMRSMVQRIRRAVVTSSTTTLARVLQNSSASPVSCVLSCVCAVGGTVPCAVTCVLPCSHARQHRREMKLGGAEHSCVTAVAGMMVGREHISGRFLMLSSGARLRRSKVLLMLGNEISLHRESQAQQLFLEERRSHVMRSCNAARSAGSEVYGPQQALPSSCSVPAHSMYIPDTSPRNLQTHKNSSSTAGNFTAPPSFWKHVTTCEMNLLKLVIKIAYSG